MNPSDKPTPAIDPKTGKPVQSSQTPTRTAQQDSDANAAKTAQDRNRNK